MYSKDMKEGGTWLAINADNGMVAFLTNRNIGNRKHIKDKLYGRYQYYS
jgi:hypothetical protein